MSRISSILKDTPSSVIDLRPALPRHLGRIIRHGLEKDVAVRYQAVLDLKNDLAELQREIESGEVLSSDALPPVAAEELRPTSPASAVGKAVIGFAAVLLLSVAGWLYFTGELTPPPHVPIRSIPVTSWPAQSWIRRSRHAAST